LEGGYELWLAGLEIGRRGDGHGRELINALFATPQGKKTWVVRIPRSSRYRAAVEHILIPLGFGAVGDTPHLRWFLREDAPLKLRNKIQDIVSAHPSLN
jgi:hypothetical protein